MAVGLLGALTWLLLGWGPAIAVTPNSAAEVRFVELMQKERADAGLTAYAVADDLVVVARKQAAAMAAEDRLFHNPTLTTDVTNWDRVAENVGTGGNVEDVDAAFSASPTHREHVLSSGLAEVGIGVVDVEGGLYVSEVFRLPTPPAPPTTLRAVPPTSVRARPPRVLASSAPAATPGAAPVARPVAPRETPVVIDPATVSLDPGDLRAAATVVARSRNNGALAVPRVHGRVPLSAAVKVAASLLVAVLGAQIVTLRRLHLI